MTIIDLFCKSKSRRVFSGSIFLNFNKYLHQHLMPFFSLIDVVHLLAAFCVTQKTLDERDYYFLFYMLCCKAVDQEQQIFQRRFFSTISKNTLHQARKISYFDTFSSKTTAMINSFQNDALSFEHLAAIADFHFLLTKKRIKFRKGILVNLNFSQKNLLAILSKIELDNENQSKESILKSNMLKQIIYSKSVQTLQALREASVLFPSNTYATLISIYAVMHKKHADNVLFFMRVQDTLRFISAEDDDDDEKETFKYIKAGPAGHSVTQVAAIAAWVFFLLGMLYFNDRKHEVLFYVAVTSPAAVTCASFIISCYRSIAHPEQDWETKILETILCLFIMVNVPMMLINFGIYQLHIVYLKLSFTLSMKPFLLALTRLLDEQSIFPTEEEKQIVREKNYPLLMDACKCNDNVIQPYTLCDFLSGCFFKKPDPMTTLLLPPSPPV